MTYFRSEHQLLPNGIVLWTLAGPLDAHTREEADDTVSRFFRQGLYT
jgi:hypothetical protein